MAKIRIHELAKQMGLTSKEIIKSLNDQGIIVNNHFSSIEDQHVNRVKTAFKSKQDAQSQIMREEIKKHDPVQVAEKKPEGERRDRPDRPPRPEGERRARPDRPPRPEGERRDRPDRPPRPEGERR
ncbi:MAG: translation initiation factor IF-2 N-terminal domain-containing protein, partial [Defluviitaleaceae bacterium]|nr:translation initiation factor IF-2 N-terminal domain-containing protein [Defluviitaleaceae bacterium]